MDIYDKLIPELTYMGLQRWLPHPKLRPYIECYWLVDAFLETERTESFYPKGGCGLIFNFADALKTQNRVFTRDVVQELSSTACPTLFQGRLHSIGVLFHPGGASAFFDVPPKEWTRSPISLDTFDATLGRLYDDMGNSGDNAARLRHLDGVLLKRFRDTTDLTIIKAFQRQIAHHPGRRVATIADQMGVTSRQLERVFLDRVGLTPVNMLRLARVETARDLLKRFDSQSLTFIGQELGYFDQAHFIREFKRVMGMTPGQYRKRSRQRRGALCME